jgi:hypothetical protein
MTNFKYLNILKKKIMEFGQLQKKSKIGKKKEKEDM